MSIVFAGGGTLGSITSLQPIIKELQKTTALPCHFIAPSGSQGKELIRQMGISWHEIPAGKLQRYPSIGWLSLVPNIYRGYRAAGKLLKVLDARVVVTTGSFVSPPVVWKAKKLGIRVIVIQLDIRVGLANKLSKPYADKVFFSYPTGEKEGEVIGPIIRHHAVTTDKVELPSGFEKDLPIIFITGGGTGAKAINEKIWELLPALTNRANIVHATGRGKARPGFEYKRYMQVEFLDADNYYYWLDRATIVIGRAGMGFFSDCIAYSKPAITIPMFATHQEDNAAFFSKAHAVITPKNKDGFTQEWLLTRIDELLNTPAKREELKTRISSFRRHDATVTVVRAIKELHGK